MQMLFENLGPNDYRTRLRKMGACYDAIWWLNQYDVAQEAWRACHHPEWMAWYLFETKGGSPRAQVRRDVVLVALRTVAGRKTPGVWGPRGKTVVRQVRAALERYAETGEGMCKAQAAGWRKKIKDKQDEFAYDTDAWFSLYEGLDALVCCASDRDRSVAALDAGTALHCMGWVAAEASNKTIDPKALQAQWIRELYPKAPPVPSLTKINKRNELK